MIPVTHYDEELYVKESFWPHNGWSTSGLFRTYDEAMIAALKERKDWGGHVKGVRIFKKTRKNVWEWREGEDLNCGS